MNIVEDIEKSDFLVAGASFSGSLLASRLAAHGKVLLIDRRIPGTRMKCAGGINLFEYQKLGIDIPNVPIRNILNSVGKREYSFPSYYTITDRRDLDRAVWEKALAAGAVFRQATFLSHDPESRKVKIRCEGRTSESSFRNLIISAGWNHCPIRNPRAIVVAEVVEGESPYPDSLYIRIPDERHVGYYWIFPMPGGRTNVGGGTFAGHGFSYSMIQEFKRRHGIGGKVLARGGGGIPMTPVRDVQQGSTYIFGDAAGLVFPLSSEGLRYISSTSKLWADAIAGGKDLNRIWTSSRTFRKLSWASRIMRGIDSFEQKTGLRIYPSIYAFGAIVKKIQG